MTPTNSEPVPPTGTDPLLNDNDVQLTTGYTYGSLLDPSLPMCAHSQVKGRCNYQGCPDGDPEALKRWAAEQEREERLRVTDEQLLDMAAGAAVWPRNSEQRTDRRKNVAGSQIDRYMEHLAGFDEVDQEESIKAQRTERRRRLARKVLDQEEAAASFPTAKLVSRSLTEELKLEPEHDEPLIQDYCPANGNVTIAGTRKVGKTTFVGNLTRSFADGIPFLGQYAVRQPGRIAIWNYEVSADQHREWLRDMGIKDTDAVEPLNLRGLNVRLNSPYAREWAVKWLRDHDIKVWIPDPGHKACSGWDPDSNPDVLEFTEYLDEIKAEAGVEAIFMPLHTGHLKKNGSSDVRARGAARWGDWPDALWTYTKGDFGKRGLAAEGRDVDMSEQTLSYDRETRLLRVSGGSLNSEVLKANVDKICEWLADHPGEHPTKSEAHDVIGMRNADSYKAITKGIEDEKLKIVQDGRSKRLYLPGDVMKGQMTMDEE